LPTNMPELPIPDPKNARTDIASYTQHPEVVAAVDKAKRLLAHKRISDITDIHDHQYIDLVMEGGGVLGVALVGYTYLLESAGIRIRNVGGASAGSINALLLASAGTIDQARSEKILPLVDKLEFFSLVDGNRRVKRFLKTIFRNDRSKLTKAWYFLLAMPGLLKEHGLNPGQTFEEWLKQGIKNFGIERTDALDQQLNAKANELLRHGDGPPLTEKQRSARLAMITADISTQSKVEFPKMAKLYWGNKWLAENPGSYVRASMSIPFFFKPFRVAITEPEQLTWSEYVGLDDIKQLPKEAVFIDGGIMSNFPIQVFHGTGVPAAPTFGVLLGKRMRCEAPFSNILKHTAGIFNASRHCLDYDFLAQNPDYHRLITTVDTGNHNWLDFNVTRESKIDLFVRGTKAAYDFLEKFDWETYKEVRRALATAHSLDPRPVKA
jgi:NTE family protein